MGLTAYLHAHSVQEPIATRPMAASSGGSGDTSDAATITANDFLTLLVTEMKNQDPTADMDPNEYINQLVNVNSLQQLVSINQELGEALGSSSDAPGTTPGVTHGVSTAANSSGHVAQAAHTHEGESASRSNGMRDQELHGLHGPAQSVAGNLSVPQPIPAARAVAQSLASARPSFTTSGATQ